MSDDTTLSPYGRGICHVCVREFNLRKDGNVRAHSDPLRWRMNCPGSGDRPRAIVSS